jgi:hypothetical protein
MFGDPKILGSCIGWENITEFSVRNSGKWHLDCDGDE